MRASKKVAGNPYHDIKNDIDSFIASKGDPAYEHSQSTHARTDATKTEKSSTNGNVLINDTETVVYTHPSGTNPHGTTKSDVGLSNVGNFKAVSTVASQGLTDTEKSNARANIGAGTSSFSGNYNDLSNKPTIPTVGDGTITIKQNGTTKGTFTTNQSGNTTIELTDSDTDTWRPVQDNLTSNSTTDSLSANQGKVLKGLIDGKLSNTLKGSASGLAELDSNGKVPASQLPSFVDDIVDGYLSSGKFYSDSELKIEMTPDNTKIYMDLNTTKFYRWSGSAYGPVNEGVVLGETSSTAYRGDRGKTAYDHSQSTHARTDATKTAKSSTNGNVLINGTETVVYTHPSGTNPHGTTKSDVGLSNVGNFKAVSTVASQGLSDTEKANARNNIGAGTSSFSGNYNDLSNKPSLATVATSGSYNDLSNKPTIPAAVAVKGSAESSYRTGNVNITAANIGLGNVGNFKAVSTVANQGLTDTEKTNARNNIGALSYVSVKTTSVVIGS